MPGGVALIALDLDGTIYAGGIPIPGAIAAIARLRTLGIPIRFATNTDSVTVPHLRDRLSEMGLAVELRELFTPVVAALRLLDQQPGAHVLAVVNEDLRHEFARYVGPGPVTHVVIDSVVDLPALAEALG